MKLFTLLIGSASQALNVYPVKFRFEPIVVHRSFQPVALNPPNVSWSDKNLVEHINNEVL